MESKTKQLTVAEWEAKIRADRDNHRHQIRRLMVLWAARCVFGENFPEKDFPRLSSSERNMLEAAINVGEI